MSQRGKRPNCHNPVDGPSPSKRRKGRPPTISIDSHEEFLSPTNGGSSTVWQARPHLDLKMSSIYNRSAPEAPAELFRKDLISAMKLPDSEPLSHEEYWVITDQWKQEWERGVQVPVNPDSLPEPSVRLNNENYYKARQDFKLPKNKYIRITKDENFSHDKHYLSNTPAIADSVCSYDLDQLDEAWLQEFNGERSMCGLPPVNEEQFERIIEELETRCHDKIQAIMKSEDGLGIEYDENVICDVCRSPDSEEANEMVFCDNCNICVHQACYGITTIPSGQWLCRTCSMGQKPDCVLCPNKGGAMKSTRSGQKWAHVSCALWIPEVSIGSVDRMEPITKISSIPQSRWALVCVLCRERVGACIQCSVKTCKTAYHVTCAFQHGLEMRAIIEDENAEDGVKLRSYCQKHSVKKEPKNSAKTEKTAPVVSASEDEEKTNKRKIRKEMTSEERNHARLARLVEIQSEFDKHVSVKDISCHLLDVDQEGINHIYNYWILKRKAGGNDPLLLPKSGDVECMSQSDQEQADVEKMKMFVHLRQDLERVRNLCYMVSRREKLSRSFFKMREQIFHKQVSILSNHHRKTTKLDDESLKAILDANHGPSIYDVLYSSNSIKDSRVLRIDEMIDLILGNNVSTTKSNKSSSLLEINGNVKKEKMDAISRYSKLFNGGNTSSNRKYNYDSITSDTDESATKQSRRKSHITSSSSAEDEPPPQTLQRSPTRSKNLSSSSNQLAISAASSVNNLNVTTPTSNANNQPKKKGRPLGSTKQATAEKRRLLNTISLVKEIKSKNLSIDSSSEDDIPPPHPKVKSPLSTRNRLMTTDDNQHLTDESDELVPIRNSSGHSIPTQGGTIKKIHSSAIYSDSDSSSTDKDNRTDYTVSDSQQQPFRTKAAMKEFNVNELLPNFNKLKKIPDVQDSTTNKKNAMSIKKSSTTPTPVTSPTPSKKHDLPPPSSSTAKKDTKPSPAKATKSRRMSTKLQNNSLSSDSEMEETKKPTAVKEVTKDVSNKEQEKKSKTQPKKDILADFLVVPQREAAKKASENLMKTNSNLMVQASSTVVTTTNEKHKRDVKEKVEEVPIPSAKSSENEKEKQKESKDGKSKSSKSTKDKSKADKKEEQKKEVKVKEKEKEKEDKAISDFPSEFLPYVPQRQAAKKAAEHIKGLGNSSLQQTTSVPEEKPKQPTTSSVTTKRSMPDRRKSVAVELSSSTSSSSSSDSDESDSESDSASQKPTNAPSKVTKKETPKALPTRRTSVAATAASLKQKTKDSPFLDKAAKSSVNVETSSSSSYESDSSSDRVNTSRLSDKRNKNKRKSIEQPAAVSAATTPASKKATPAASPKKSTNTTKKESDQKPPTRRMSTITKPAPITSPTISKTNSKTAQKPPEPPKPVEQQVTSSRKRSTSTASPPKVSSNSKSRATESSKRDLAKLSDKEKSSTDLKKPESRTSTPTPIIAAPSIQPEKQTTTNQKTDSFEVAKKRRSSVVSTPKSKDKESPKDDMDQKITEIVKEPTKVSVESTKTPVVEKEKVIEPEIPVKEKEQPVVVEKKIEKEKPVKEKEKPVKEKEKSVKEKEKTAEKMEIKKPITPPDIIEINDESENDEQRKPPVRAEIKEKEKVQEIEKEKSKVSAFDDDISEVKMDIDDTISEPKQLTNIKQQIIQESKFPASPKTNIPMTSPMVSIPTENLNRMQEKSNETKQQLIDETFKTMPITTRQETSTSNSNTIFEPIKPLSIEDTERESYNLIEKLKKNKKPTNATIISDNNNIANEKPNEILKPCMMQNENTPKHDNFDQIAQPQIPLRPPNASPLTECNELKKLSPWHHQQQQQQQAQSHPINENTNFPQRNILTSSCNKLNSPMEQTSTPPSCMVIEQQQKQLAACQKMSEENNMMVSNRASMFMPQMNMLMNDPTANHMDVFEMQMQQQQQQQKWHKDSKSMNLKMMQQQQQQQHDRMQENLIKRTDSGMENMMNNMNQQVMKNFAAMQKSPGNFVPMQPHMGPQQQGPHQGQQPQENFNAYNYSDHANQFTSAVSLFPPDLNVQVPFPSPGQAMFAPNFANTFTNAQQHNQNNDHSMMMQTSSSHIKLNSNDMTSSMHFGGQNVCPPNMFNPQQQQQPILPNDLQMIPNIPPNNSMDCSNLIPSGLDKQQPQDIAKKSPSKSTRSSPRNTTPNYVGGKTPQKSPSKSPRQPSTPASLESLSRQNSQKGKMTPTTNEGKQRKSRSNSQASPVTTPADHRAANNKARQRANKNTKGRFPQNAMPFIPFNNEADYITIDKKLVGTVYDFSADEDFPTSPSVENLTLRAMRDRRKSVDLYNKMNKDGSSQSPKFMKSSLKPSTPLSHPLAINNHTMPNTVVNESEQLPVTASSITNINLVNMPGPVDMRTYNSFDNTNDSYSSQLLGAFATNTVDQTLNEIDEEQEKELQTALKASNDKQKTPTTNASSNVPTNTETAKSTTEVSNIVEESIDSEASFAKVSLSDSRNQLKLKIKGPLAHHHDMQSQSVTHAQIAPQTTSSATSSNRRQMRKKELLQQYWNQGNTDQEPLSIVSNDQQVPSNISSNRVGGIPKAVDSMGLSLLKDEFQDFNYAEYKKRKRFALRGVDPLDVCSSNLDVSNVTNEVDPLAIDTTTNNKKRSRRPGRGNQQQNLMGTPNPPPKLKIKIGADIMETTGSDLPPKKRLIAQPPSYQDLKRESMNFRKQMMTEFSEQSKEQRQKQEKRERKEKKKRKKEKKRSVEIVSKPISEGAPVKLILKISNKSSASLNTSASSEPSSKPLVNEQVVKSTPPPIKLKLSRNSTGKGEYNILNTSASDVVDKQKNLDTNNSSVNNQNTTSVSNPNNNNNNLQPPIIDASDINAITTKKLEVSLERIEDIEKAKSEFSNKQLKETSKDDVASNNCEVR